LRLFCQLNAVAAVALPSLVGNFVGNFCRNSPFFDKVFDEVSDKETAKAYNPSLALSVKTWSQQDRPDITQHELWLASVLWHLVVADGAPLEHQIPFLTAAGGLALVAIMSVDVSRALRHRILRPNVPFQPLVHVPSLSDVDRNPLSILALASVDEVSGQRLKSSINRKDFILVLLSRLAGPVDAGGGGFRLVTVTE
jgi:hypothetical protein